MDKTTFNAYVNLAYLIVANVNSHLGETLADIWRDDYINDVARREALLGELLCCSDEEKVAWDALLLIVQFHIGEDMPLPFRLKHWLLEMLANIRRKPKPKGIDPYANYVRDVAIVEAVDFLSTQEGIQATRNINQKKNEKKNGKKNDLRCAVTGGRSACDMVGIAVRRHFGQSPGYKRIEGIWLESASPKSPLYRFGPSKRPIIEHPLYILRDRKEKIVHHMGYHENFMEQPSLDRGVSSNFRGKEKG